jgi:hypothetical protein
MHLFIFPFAYHCDVSVRKIPPSRDLDVIAVFYTLNMKGKGNLPNRVNERRTFLLEM